MEMNTYQTSCCKPCTEISALCEENLEQVALPRSVSSGTFHSTWKPACNGDNPEATYDTLNKYGEDLVEGKKRNWIGNRT